MKLTVQGLQDRAAWESKGIRLPEYDIAAITAATKAAPTWVHFGAGNIFRAFIAALQQRLLNEGKTDKGIVVAESYDDEIISKIYIPHDSLTVNVTLNADASTDFEVLASMAESLAVSGDMERLSEIFRADSLQMVSFTITEKGYALTGANGELLSVVAEDMHGGPDKARHAMSVVAALLFRRYRAGGRPIAVVSMDNCSHNGEKLQRSILMVAEAWVKNGFADGLFLDWLRNESAVSFPWSMIDKITPRPAESVEQALADKGVEGIAPIITGKGTYIAAFVNAERPQYLVIEDKFPNGRPALEQAGVYFTDRDTVNKVERMKVTTCLNPLHTAMSVYGCLLGYTRISDEMKDSEIVKLVKRLGYVEGLPVVTDPGILSPKAFIDEVIEDRFPNPFVPDEPLRITTDTSQKVGIRFGETVKSYLTDKRDLDVLVALPLALAGWMRYLLAVDDEGNPMQVSADPLLPTLQKALSCVRWNDPASYHGELRTILANDVIFGLDLSATPLAARIEEMFLSLLAGSGAVRKTLQKYLG